MVKMALLGDLFGVGGITTLADDIIKLIPNKNNLTPQEAATLQLDLAQLLMAKEINTSQAATNTAEASNPNLWVSGWRPGIGWACMLAFVWQFIVLQILVYINAQFNHNIVVPVFDTASMITILTGMLGLSGMRSYDKITVAKLNANKKPIRDNEDEDDN